MLALCRLILNGKGGRKEVEGRQRVKSERKEKKTYKVNVDTHMSTTHTIFVGSGGTLEYRSEGQDLGLERVNVLGRVR